MRKTISVLLFASLIAIAAVECRAVQMAESTVETVRKTEEQATAAVPIPTLTQSTAVPLDPTLRSARLPVLEKDNYVGIGLYSQHTFWFDVTPNVEIVGPLKLVYSLSHSTTLASESSLTILFNDEPLESIRLLPQNTDKETSARTIDSKRLRPGANSLKFRVYAIADILHPCQDMSNPANWAVVHKDSYLEVQYRTKGIEDLRLFPEPYVRRGALTRFPLALVFPDSPGFEDLRAAALIVQYLGTTEPFAYDRMDVVLGKDIPADISKQNNMISFGDIKTNIFRDRFNELPAEVKQKLDDKTGIVMKGETGPLSGKALTVISGKTPRTLYKSAEALTFPSLVQRMKGSSAMIDSSQALPERETDKSLMNPTFASLNIPTTKITGIFETRTDFLYIPPPHWKLLPGTMLTLDVSFSALLDPNASIVSVLINDRPIKSFKLKGKDGVGQFQIRIPDEMLDDPRFYIVIVASLALDEGRRSEDWCMDAHHDKAWLILHDTSYMHTPHALMEDVNFRTFPSAFLEDVGLRQMRIILPDNPTRKEYGAAFNIIYGIASLTPTDKSPHFEILKSSEVTSAVLTNYDLIVIGSYARNPLIKQLNDHLPLPLNPDTGKPTETRIEILPQFLDHSAVLELAVSPWNPKANILLVNSNEEDLVELASQMFLIRSIASSWTGNITLVNAKDQWFSYDFGSGKKKSQKRQSYFYVYVWGGTMLALALLIGWIIYRRNKYGLRDPFAGSE